MKRKPTTRRSFSTSGFHKQGAILSSVKHNLDEQRGMDFPQTTGHGFYPQKRVFHPQKVRIVVTIVGLRPKEDGDVS